MDDDAPASEPAPTLGPRAQLLGGRALIFAAVLLSVALGTPRSSPLLPVLVPAAPLLGPVFALAVLGFGWVAQRQAGLIWVGAFALLGALLYPCLSNTALEGAGWGASQGVHGPPELILRAATAGSFGLWVQLERRHGVFHRPS